MRGMLHWTLSVGCGFCLATSARSAQDLDPSAKTEELPLAVAPFNSETARRHQEQWAKHLDVPRVMTNSIGMKLALIPAGEFQMGSDKPIEEIMRTFQCPEFIRQSLADEHPQHRVRIMKPFYLQTTEVTQRQWQSVMGTKPWAEKRFVAKAPDHAASYVSWNDAQQFCRRLNVKEGGTYRLPTEAEWEYACRAGTTTTFHSGDNPSQLKDYARFGRPPEEYKIPYTPLVASKKPNAFGLYDMHGNVWEWCQDWYDRNYYANSPPDDPQGPSAGSNRVLRSGGWSSPADACRAAHRHKTGPIAAKWSYLGFRVASSSVRRTSQEAEPGTAVGGAEKAEPADVPE